MGGHDNEDLILVNYVDEHDIPYETPLRRRYY